MFITRPQHRFTMVNFQSLPVVESADFLLDKAFSRARKKGDLILSTKNRNTDRVLLKKHIAHERILVVKQNLIKDLQRTIEAFPDFNGLPEFYEQLAMAQMDLDNVKLSLGRMQGAIKQLAVLANEARRDVSATHDTPQASKAVLSYYGRVSSLIKRLNSSFTLLEKTRKILTTFPTVKTGLFTVALAGFPNVGKSTLLAKLTPAKPEIANYAFTTKKLNMGYFKDGFEKVQVVDTPGTLSRFEKMNAIERQAFLCLRYVADIIILVFDPIDESDKQLKLLKELKEHDKPLFIYLSKTDICSKEELNAAKKHFKDVLTQAEKVKEIIIKSRKEE